MSACWWLCWEDANSTKSSAKSSCLMLQLPAVKLLYSAVTVYPSHVHQACTTHGLRKLFLRPARAFWTVESVAKARPRISNCCSTISSILQRNLHIEIKWTFAARGKLMLIIWPWELSDLCRPDVGYTMKNSSASTHPYRSSAAATVNGRDFTLLTRTQTSDQEYSDLAASNSGRQPCSLLTHHSTNLSRENRSYAFSNSTRQG